MNLSLGFEKKLSHDDLVSLGEKWLINTKKCSFAFSELKCTRIYEIPDCIGFRDGYSVLIECKASRADFLSDKKKMFRKYPEQGLGSFRFFLCPEGVINPSDLPEKWGLVWITVQGKARQIVGPKGNAWSYTGGEHEFRERNLQGEWFLMTSALRRIHLRGLLPSIYEPLEGA
ncbi:hypothetical protein KAR91_37045 [Candidatus Pacearchaeota archaeon]|nr:hypothetical protein [Candidatus Pacearchaeota archaeon]